VPLPCPGGGCTHRAGQVLGGQDLILGPLAEQAPALNQEHMGNVGNDLLQAVGYQDHRIGPS